jgi:hypothetical protein
MRRAGGKGGGLLRVATGFAAGKGWFLREMDDATKCGVVSNSARRENFDGRLELQPSSGNEEPSGAKALVYLSASGSHMSHRSSGAIGWGHLDRLQERLSPFLVERASTGLDMRSSGMPSSHPS